MGTDQVILYTCLTGIMPNKGRQNARSIDTCPGYTHTCAMKWSSVRKHDRERANNGRVLRHLFEK